MILETHTERRSSMTGQPYPRCQYASNQKQCGKTVYSDGLCWSHYRQNAPSVSGKGRAAERKVKGEVMDRPHVGQSVIWLEQRKWGGKQNQPARYLHGVGRQSARIELTDKTEKTVRLSSLQWERPVATTASAGRVNGEPI